MNTDRSTAGEMSGRLADRQEHASAVCSIRPTNFSRRWISTSTPDLAFAPEDLSRKYNRKVMSQFAGSGYRSVLLAINLQYRPSNPKSFPRWNYKKVDWEMFPRLTNEYCRTVKADHFDINKATDSFNQSILRAASETIPREAWKNYRPYWTEELQGLEDEVARTREILISIKYPYSLHCQTPSSLHTRFKNKLERKNKQTNKQQQQQQQTTKTKTEKLNLDRDGKTLWKLTKVTNKEETES